LHQNSVNNASTLHRIRNAKSRYLSWYRKMI